MKQVRHTRPSLRGFIVSLLLVCLTSGGGNMLGQHGPRAGRTTQASGTVSQTRRGTPAPAPAPKQSEASAPRPRLVLLIVVDQFRYDYLERFGDLFVDGGLRRLMRDGALWTEANYDHMPTYTAPGHATLMTGAWPAETGIVGNDWFDRDTGKRVTSVSDESTKLLGGEAGASASSPRRLMASTLGDELRLATNDRAKVIGISVKDRSAILPAGRHANASYWFGTKSGAMVSSDYYFNQLPAWASNFDAQRPADKYFGARWERLLPESEYLKRAGADAPLWESLIDAPGDTNSFPHIIKGGAERPGQDFYEALDYSPFSNDLLVDFAKEAITNEHLGEDEETDVLTVSFSANDYVGHRFGPYSQEVMDATLRVDRQIAALLDFINTRVGLGKTVVAFTADHGVAPIPEHSNMLGLPGGRIQSVDVLRAIHLALTARYNPKNAQPDPTADYILKYKEGDKFKDAFFNDNVYFNTVALKRDGVEMEEIERVGGEAAMTVPGIRRYFTRAQLERGAVSPADPLARRVLHGFYARRSGDVVFVYEPFKYLLDSPVLATHGSPYSYDTHVPVMIMGGGITPGRYKQSAMPSDIAPTLAALLRVQAPSNSVGRVLTEAFSTIEKPR
ncbi:MAG TPA: alkaline phosphatase family protein [Pyrinomonadaceae bacterium]|nr:alkaline phosphatase family protein [Pyrinomonadaceae bacterium]